jgi:hypothetical protein
MISEAVDPVKNQIADFDAFKGQADVRMQRMEADILSIKTALPTSVADGKTVEKVQKLEALVAGMHIAPVTKLPSTAMIGGLGSVSPDAAVEWVRQSLRRVGIQDFSEIFHKALDGQFNGNVFVKFNDHGKREEAIKVYNAKKLTNEGKFMSPDLPIERRIPVGFLLGFKRLLVEWKFRKNSVQVDTDALTISIDRVDIAKAKVDDYTLKIHWESEQWQQWKALSEDEAFLKLQTDANTKLKNAKEKGGKGKGRDASA